MTLDDLFTQIIHGELRHIFMDETTDPVEELPKDKRAQILSSIQLGLTELHKRFLLKEGRFALNLIEGKQTYILNKRFALANTRSRETAKYIDDLSEPFHDNLFKVERIYDAAGKPLPLNEIDNPDSLRTSGYDCLVLPDNFIGTALYIIYRADHPALDRNLAGLAPTQVHVSLPSTHLEALLLYVAARYTTPLGMSNEFHEGNNYMQKFEASCARLNNDGYQIQQTTDNSSRFEQKGFV